MDRWSVRRCSINVWFTNHAAGGAQEKISMKLAGRLLFVTLALGIFGLALSLIGHENAHAVGSFPPPAPTPVSVSNTPLPVNANVTNTVLPVQGTVNAAQSGSWNVGINGTPTVQLAAGATVGVNGTPTVQLAPGATVAVSGGTVKLANTAATPFYTRDTNNPSSQSFAVSPFGDSTNFTIPTTSGSQTVSVAVLQQLSLQCYPQSTPEIITFFYQPINLTSSIGAQNATLTFASQPAGDYSVVSPQTLTAIYAVPGSTVSIASFNSNCSGTLSGYLVTN